MNANELADELADELEEHSQGPNLTQLGAAWFLEIATMLRQQQAEIEALKRGNEATALLNYNKGHEDGRNLVIPSPVKDKPHPKCDEACMYLCRMRELTDEEIMEIVADKYEKGHGRYIDTKLFFVEFTKAILRKAQEK